MHVLNLLCVHVCSCVRACVHVCSCVRVCVHVYACATINSRHAEDPMFQKAASVTRDVLVYHRGVGQASVEGYFIVEKVDLIFEMLLTTLMSVLSLFAFWNFRKHANKISELIDDSDDEEDEQEEDEDLFDEDIKTKHVKRQGLSDVIKRNWMALFRRNEIFEPTFKEIVLIYRPNKFTVEDELGETKTIDPIYVKSFKEIPHADFEVVLPAQTTRMRARDLIKVVGGLLVGCLAIYSKVRCDVCLVCVWVVFGLCLVCAYV